MKLSQILSAVGLAPKDLEQARNTIEPAKAALEQANTLFANAGLNLESMLEAGPDALKAHIESLGNSEEELASALLEVESLTAKAEAIQTKVASLESAFASTGLKLEGVEDVKAAFADHVKKAAAVELAKAGHPPVAVVNVEQKTATQEEIFATYKAMPPGD
jgi:chromosome segregation ATPase